MRSGKSWFDRRPAAMGTVGGILFGLIACAAAFGAAAPASHAPAPARPELERRFTTAVRPFLKAYCVSCHSGEKPAAQLDLSAFQTLAAVEAAYPHWGLVLEKLDARQMPPAGAAQPPAAQREAVVGWVRALRTYEAERNAGDPGTVLARRLSNAEYDYSIRDLTGQDLHPTREFPVDPANQEGFDNSGESLSVSPALMKKYLQAARGIADHLVLQPTGFDFAPHPMLAETDRDKYCILRIVDFYKRQPTDYAAYFLAAWRYRHRAALGTPKETLDAVAAKARVSPRYLQLVWSTLTGPPAKVGPLAKLQAMWNALPPPEHANLGAAPVQCAAMRDWVAGMRKKLAYRFNNLRVPSGFSTGGQCFVLWKDREYASHRRQLDPDALQLGGVPSPRAMFSGRRRRGMPEQPPPVPQPDPELFVPVDQAAAAPYLASFRKFCEVFPDAFYIPERGRMFLDDPNDKGRLLSAGLHNQMGYFRDDTPLSELILDEKGRQALERLWLEFDFVAFVPERMHTEFIFYERAESGTIRGSQFDFARSEDKDITSDAKIQRLADVYLAHARENSAYSGGLDATTQQAIEEYFQRASRNIRAIQKARLAAEPSHLTALLEFARRAYRRPLTDAERESLLAFYRTSREKEGLSHEDAMRDGVVSVLISPNFLFRVDLEDSLPGALPAKGAKGREKGVSVTASPVRTIAAEAIPARVAARSTTSASGSGSGSARIQQLSDYALASRLSYFLWSSLPDEELLSHAAAGDLHRPEVVAAQARRMLKDPRARALALEFGGNWLDFRRFEEHNAVDRDRFPQFTDELRESMFQEPLRFLLDTIQQDRSVLDLLYGKHTFVDAALAKHYHMDGLNVPPNAWVRVPDADRYGRGGLLPMAVFLTQNSPGLRTSPVKRGYWLVRRVLGERIPPPPPTVPELPKDEGQLGDRTLRQVLEQHRANPACAGCHARFDSFGLVFENYGPVGELRTKDLGGKPVDTRAVFPGGSEETGVSGLQAYLRSRRQGDFLDTLCRKLLSYGLGRTLLPSDDPLLQQMRQKLTAGGYKFSTLVDAVVGSRQFRTRRAEVVGS